MNVIGLITARGGSKGIKGKNIKNLAGKPLIAWTIDAAKASQRLTRVIVSTDDPEIASVAQEYGAEVPFLRPAELAQDDTPHVLVVEHAYNWLGANGCQKPDYIVTLQPTSPFRTSADIDNAIELVQKSNAIAVVSVCPMHPHPYLAKTIRGDGTIVAFIEHGLKYLRHQDMPPAYALNGAIFINRCAELLISHDMQPKETIAYIMPSERSIDIDTSWDFQLAELIFKEIFSANRQNS